MNIWASVAPIWLQGKAVKAPAWRPVRRVGTRQEFDVAMQCWQESTRLWELALAHGTQSAQVADAYAHYELDAANVRALYQQAER